MRALRPTGSSRARPRTCSRPASTSTCARWPATLALARAAARVRARAAPRRCRASSAAGRERAAQPPPLNWRGALDPQRRAASTSGSTSSCTARRSSSMRRASTRWRRASTPPARARASRPSAAALQRGAARMPDLDRRLRVPADAAPARAGHRRAPTPEGSNPNRLDLRPLNDIDRRILKESFRAAQRLAAAHRARLHALSARRSACGRSSWAERALAQTPSAGWCWTSKAAASMRRPTGCWRWPRWRCGMTGGAPGSTWPTVSRRCCSSPPTPDRRTSQTSWCMASELPPRAAASIRPRRWAASRPSSASHRCWASTSRSTGE